MRPGLTTATQYSGAPLPLPIRVSAGFLVTGLSGNMRIQILPPRLMWRVIAIRAASICRSVIHAGSKHFSPYSPKLISLPRVATPVMRPRICFRCFTFFGINITFSPFPIVDCQLPIGRSFTHVFQSAIGNCQSEILLVFAPWPPAFSSAFTLASSSWPPFALAHTSFVNRIRTGATRHRRLGIQNLAAINPNLHADLAKRRFRFCQTVIDVRSQRVQGKLPLQMPLTARDLSTVQTATDFHLDPLRAET